MNSKLFPESYESHGMSRRKIDFEILTPIIQGRIAYKQNGLQSTDKMDQNGLYTESSHPSPSPTMDVLSPKYLPGMTHPSPQSPHSYVVLQVIFIVRDKEQLPTTLLDHVSHARPTSSVNMGHSQIFRYTFWSPHVAGLGPQGFFPGCGVFVEISRYRKT